MTSGNRSIDLETRHLRWVAMSQKMQPPACAWATCSGAPWLPPVASVLLGGFNGRKTRLGILGGFRKGVCPPKIDGLEWKIHENPTKMNDLGVALF